MAITSRKGFALLIAIIFMSVMLTFGLALGSLGLKQQMLASSAVESQYAFYAADTALECALYADQILDLFRYSPSTLVAPKMTCDGALASSASIVSRTSTDWTISNRVSLDGGKRCADVTIYKPEVTQSGTVYLYAQGYNASCSVIGSPGGNRVVSRGEYAKYTVSPSF
jgi:hypothetical protein